MWKFLKMHFRVLKWMMNNVDEWGIDILYVLPHFIMSRMI